MPQLRISADIFAGPKSICFTCHHALLHETLHFCYLWYFCICTNFFTLEWSRVVDTPRDLRN